MRAQMKSFAERSSTKIGIVSMIVVSALVVFGLTFDKVPFLSGGDSYSAYFADAGALKSGADVQVSGAFVGKVTSIKLDGSKVLIAFTISDGIALGDRTEAAIKTNTLLGTKIVQITPRGQGKLSGPIPVERTTSPYSLTDALGDLSETVGALNTDQLSSSLETLSQTFQNTPPELRIAVEGVSRFSKAINNRDEQLRTLLANANKATAVLGQRTDQVVGLIKGTNALLAQLRTQSGALEQIAGNLTAVSRQLSGLIADNADLRPTLDRLNSVLSILDNRKGQIQKSVKLLNAYAMSLGESVSSGPFFNAYVANLLPGQFVQPFVDAAFSDLGLDPHVLSPSQRVDPPTGQRAMPALPVPYPRTGQGGPPNLTLPDAITGKPGDVRYPYREPLPAPPPGGPPPGPPAPAAPGLDSTPEPTPKPTQVDDPIAAPTGPQPGPRARNGGSSQ